MSNLGRTHNFLKQILRPSILSLVLFCGYKYLRKILSLQIVNEVWE